MTFWVALRCLQKDSIECRFLVGHYNGKCLCKIRKTYCAFKLNIAICIYSTLAICGHMLREHQTSVTFTDTLNLYVTLQNKNICRCYYHVINNVITINNTILSYDNY